MGALKIAAWQVWQLRPSAEGGARLLSAMNTKEAQEREMDYWTEKLTYKAGSAYLGQGFRIKKLFDDHVGTLRAIDPVSGSVPHRAYVCQLRLASTMPR